MNKSGILFIAIGILLLVAALSLVAYNVYCDNRAANTVSQVLREIRNEQKAPSGPVNSSEQPPMSDESDIEAESQVETDVESAPIIPDFLRDRNMAMPTVQIDGEDYIGVIDIPSLALSLPIINEWSYPRLKLAPCRYQGSAYLDNMIIAAHNYKSHFGTLKNLKIGDRVYFTDMAENVFLYKVVELETLGGSAVESMVSGEWDLTLFTCTVGGKTRVTVRCERAE